MTNPLTPFFIKQRYIILDGGLATELENKGADLKNPLWSAKILFENPELIKSVYRDYLESGADIICSASYQATIPGFLNKGLSAEKAKEFIALSVILARQAVEEFWTVESNRANRIKPLVAASIGPYGAYLADGSEYTGKYHLDEEQLRSFHLTRFQLLTESTADLIAFETIPRVSEVKALCNLLEMYPDKTGWLSLSCPNGKTLASGENIEDALEVINQFEQIVAVGVNCITPHLVHDLLEILNRNTKKPIILYPNKGEKWDPEKKVWLGDQNQKEWFRYASDWVEKGVRIVGGCCRTTPGEIQMLRQIMFQQDAYSDNPGSNKRK